MPAFPFEYYEDIRKRWGYEGMEVGGCWLWKLCIRKWDERVFDGFSDFETVEKAECQQIVPQKPSLLSTIDLFTGENCKFTEKAEQPWLHLRTSPFFIYIITFIWQLPVDVTNIVIKGIQTADNNQQTGTITVSDTYFGHHSV